MGPVCCRISRDIIISSTLYHIQNTALTFRRLYSKTASLEVHFIFHISFFFKWYSFWIFRKVNDRNGFSAFRSSVVFS